MSWLAATPELFDGAVDVLRAGKGLGEAQVRQRVGGVELDDAPEHLDGLDVFVARLQLGGDFVQGGDGVRDEPELLVQLGELRGDVRVTLV